MFRKIFQIVLYLAAGVYAVLGIRKITAFATNPDADGVILLVGFFFLAVAAVAAGVTFIARKWPGLLVLPALILAGPATFYLVLFGPMLWADEDRARQSRDQRSGKEDFGDQPALFAVAQAIVNNDPAAIRAAAKNVPDLNAAGRGGTTLLYFAVDSTWQHEERVEAVKTLISLGAEPNYNNGRESSFALAHAARASAVVLRAMLDGGGDPNGRDADGLPIIFSNWHVGYYTTSQYRPRLSLLLERGADINATMPETGCCAGYSLVLNVTDRALDQERNYEYALDLLELGADPNRVAADGMTLAKKLTARREKFAREKKAPPREFEQLWEWAQAHGIFSPPQE